MFQSQTRSRSTCDSTQHHRYADEAAFQSQTRSRSTCDFSMSRPMGARMIGFNLRREAAPHATAKPGRISRRPSLFQSQTRSRSTCDLPSVVSAGSIAFRFNLRREAAPHATAHQRGAQAINTLFQSQTRSRSTCDMIGMSRLCHVIAVSISDEKPLHMRQLLAARGIVHCAGFNLRREAAPHATIEPILEATELSPVSISDEKPLHMRPKEDPSA